MAGHGVELAADIRRRVQKVFQRWPELLILLVAEGWLLILATLFEVTLVFVVIAYSTWVVLPWAFFDKLNEKKAEEQKKWLRRAQGLLFVAGTFFMLYVLVRVGSEVGKLDPVIKNALPFMRGLLFVSGFGTLLAGLYDSFRVINFTITETGIDETQFDTFRLVSIPLLALNDFILGTQVVVVWYSSPTLSLNFVGWLYLASLLVGIVGSVLVLKWMESVYALARAPNGKGLIVLALFALPYGVIFGTSILAHLGAFGR